MRWPFKAWGADVVLSGHAHVYERLSRGGLTYVVNGLGGQTRYTFGKALSGSKVRYKANWGAQKVTVTKAKMTFRFYSVSGHLVDTFSITAPTS
jgi:hypothetical protein